MTPPPDRVCHLDHFPHLLHVVDANHVGATQHRRRDGRRGAERPLRRRRRGQAPDERLRDGPKTIGRRGPAADRGAGAAQGCRTGACRTRSRGRRGSVPGRSPRFPPRRSARQLGQQFIEQRVVVRCFCIVAAIPPVHQHDGAPTREPSRHLRVVGKRARVVHDPRPAATAAFATDALVVSTEITAFVLAASPG